MPMEFPLPDPFVDPIIRLHDYYFQPAELLYRNFEKLKIEFEKRGRLTPKKTVELQSFFQIGNYPLDARMRFC
jgi:hypothetical protein